MGIQQRPPKNDGENEENESSIFEDGANHSIPLPETEAIGRLNVAITDGYSTCTARYHYKYTAIITATFSFDKI